MQTAYIGLGANLGDRGETMREALRRIAAHPRMRLAEVSAFYETPPWGKTDQPSFLNAAACVTFDMSPQELLEVLQGIERDLGRVRREHWGARTIDLDILHIDDVETAGAELTLPHPYLCERAFVLVPLAEIEPRLVVRGKTVTAWCAGVDTSGIVRGRTADVLRRGYGAFPCGDDRGHRHHGAAHDEEPAGQAAARRTGEHRALADA